MQNTLLHCNYTDTVLIPPHRPHDIRLNHTCTSTLPSLPKPRLHRAGALSHSVGQTTPSHTQFHLAFRTGALPASANLAEPPPPTPRRLPGTHACLRIRWVSVSTSKAVRPNSGTRLRIHSMCQHTPCQAHPIEQHMSRKVYRTQDAPSRSRVV
jgi:hypothetical protein